jgi:hypothetical protein
VRKQMLRCLVNLCAEATSMYSCWMRHMTQDPFLSVYLLLPVTAVSCVHTVIV